MPLDNKISNIIGVQIPKWVKNQLQTRSQQNSQDFRDESNLVYLSNKTAWIRLVSSVNVNNPKDIEYFKNLGAEISDETSLAKNYVLFGGTSKYLNENGKPSYQLRSGLNGSYGMLGQGEIQKYGYRPMPGITSVNIETQGRLGSIRQATVNFKCWDKSQLDIIDILYFKMGFTMFLEWGHTYFYPSANPIGNEQKLDPNKLYSTELYSLDPFEKDLTKEEILKRIAQNCRDTEGNYDAMLGMVTNFNFSYNQEGGFDCSLKMIGLGVLGDSIKINNPGNLPNILKEQIKKYNNILEEIERTKKSSLNNPSSIRTLPALTRDQIYEKLLDESQNIENSILGLTSNEQTPAQDVYIDAGSEGNLLYISRINKFLPIQNFNGVKISFNQDFIEKLISDKTTKLQDNLFSSIFWKESFGKDFPREKKDDLGFLLETKYNLKNKKLNEDFKFEIWRQRSEITPNGISDDVKSSIEKQLTSKNLRPAKGGYTFTQSRLPNALKSELLNNEDLKVLAGITLPNGFLVNSKAFKKIGEIIKETITSSKNFNILSIETDPYQARNEIRNLPAILKYTFTVKVDLPIMLPSIITVSNIEDNQLKKAADKSYNADAEYIIEAYIRFQDTLAIQDIIAPNFIQPNIVQGNSKKEEQANPQDASTEQTRSPLDSLSGLELVLRTVQVHSLVKSIQNKGDLNISNTVVPIELSKEPEFIRQIFSEGVFSKFIGKLIDGTIQDQNYDTLKSTNQEEILQIQAKYGFATSLMANREKLYELTDAPAYYGDVGKILNRNFDPVDFKALLTAYVIPYRIDQSIEEGTTLNHPVYIPFGQLLMYLNSNSTIYENDQKNQVVKPLVYIDFNPNHNYCLSNSKQLSTDPFTALIPFEGSDSDYASLFDNNVLLKVEGDTKLSEYAIAPLSGSNQITPLFEPKSGNDFNFDTLSNEIPSFRYDAKQTSYNPYRGKIMNVLLNIDYIMQILKDFSLKDGESKVYLKPMIEQILTDINKSLGNFNVFRLSYNDQGNVFQIVDDQIIPTDQREQRLDTTTLDSDLPLFGKTSIAKSLEIKSEVASKLANMIAISANADVKSKATLSTDGTSFGYINFDLKDRYIPNRGESANKGSANNDSVKNAAIQFNNAIKSFYSSVQPAKDQVGFATNYYMEKMNSIKGTEPATVAANSIPVSVNFTTDGISGVSMGQAFTIQKELLPYVYGSRTNISGNSQINKIGFAIAGLSHTIDNNSWNTSIRAIMIFLKDEGVFANLKASSFKSGKFSEEVPSTDNIVRVTGTPLTKQEQKDNEKFTYKYLKNKGLVNYQIAAVMGAFREESSFDPLAFNEKENAFGIGQWRKDRKQNLERLSNYRTLEGQLNFFWTEAGQRGDLQALQKSVNIQQAFNAMAKYERFSGYDEPGTSYYETRLATSKNYINYIIS